MKAEAVILAAGYSGRAGVFKLEQQAKGKAMLEYTIAALLPYTEQIYVVGGYQIEKIDNIVRKYKEQVRLVNNPDYDKGMFSSVKCGIRHTSAEWIYLTPGDCPEIGKAVGELHSCLATHQDFKMLIPTCDGRGGHPVVIRGKCREEILSLSDEASLKLYRNSLGADRIARIETGDRGILTDYDTRKDMEKWRQT